MNTLRRLASRIPKKWAAIGGSVVVGLAPVAVVVSSMSNPASAILPVNRVVDGTHNIIVFPQRDFVSAPGYTPGDTAIVRVFHDPELYPDNSAAPIVSEIATADDTGTIEINHPGGFCWATTTPDIRPGDIVQIEVTAGAEINSINETRVANVRTRRPIQTAVDTVQVHGTASDIPSVGGNPIDVTKIEHRLVAPGSAFAATGKRTMRAPGLAVGIAPAVGDGTIAYDAPGSLNWTATYSGLSPADVQLALGAESRILWLGDVVAPAVESTIFENSPLAVAGPAAPCTAPLEVLPPPVGVDSVPPTTPTDVVATQNPDNHNSVDLTWTASTDDTGVTAYGVFRNGQLVFTVQNADLSAPAPTVFTDTNVPPGDYTWTIEALDDVGNASGQSAPSDSLNIAAVGAAPVPNEPPHLPVSIIAFPSRDFISPSGYEPTDVVTVQVLRRTAAGEQVISQAEGIIPNAEGFAEVNHPGGACWANLTPEIRAGDIIRTIAYSPDPIAAGHPLVIRTIDQTHVAGVTTTRPNIVTAPSVGLSDGVVEVKGTALGADGNPIPLAQIEQRMIAVHGVGLWDLNGRRALRAGAGGDGTLSYDTLNNPMGINWTATYTGLDQADVDRMADADTRIHWLGTQPLLLAEATIYEHAANSIPGPAGPGCSSPIETPDTQAPTAPSIVSLTGLGAGVNLTWTPSTDDWAVAGYRIFDNGAAIANVGPQTTSYTAAHLTPGNHTIAVAAYDNASPLSGAGDFVARLKAAFGLQYGNLSALSSSSVTLADVTAPTVPQNLVATVDHLANLVGGGGQVKLTWDGSSDDAGVTTYLVHRNPHTSGSPADLNTGSIDTTYTDKNPPTGLDAGDYTYTVEAVDAAGNKSGESAPVQIRLDTIADVLAPTVPTNVTSQTVDALGTADVHGRNIAITWAASTDDSGHVGSYVVARKRVAVQGFGAVSPVIDVDAGWTQVATVNGTTLSYLDTNLASSTYAYAVRAVDSSSNASARSADSPAAVVANDPGVTPHSLIGFPQRDFVSATTYDINTSYHFNLIRPSRTFTSTSQASDGVGTIEVNHPGGTCWAVNTPNMVPGDVIQIANDVTGVVEQTTIANVTAERPIRTGVGTVVVHGTATAADGSPIPIDQIENRLVSGKDLFDLNGKRVLRGSSAVADGTLAYDAPGSTHWTATYTGLGVDDVYRIVGGTSTAAGNKSFPGSESRGMWLGRNPLALAEGTIFENGTGVAGGPAGAPSCTTPAETPAPAATLAPQALSVANAQFLPALQTTAMGTVTLSNGGSSPLQITNIYMAGANPGDFVRTGGTCPTLFPATLAVSANCTVTLAITPTALGLRQGFLAVSDNTANTTDQTVSLTAIAVDNTHPTIAVNPNTFAFPTVNGGATFTKSFVITNNSPDGSAQPLTFTVPPSITGTNASDFVIAGNTCAGASLRPLSPDSCSVSVTFTPGARAARTATLVLNHVAAPNATSTSVLLTGTGGSGSVITFGANPITFGSVKTGTTKDQTISVKNSGNVAATGLTVLNPGGLGYSRVSTTCTATLAANASCNVVVRFTAPAGTGSSNGSLTITTTNGIPLAAATTLTASWK